MQQIELTRRELLQRVGSGIGSIALSTLLARESAPAAPQASPAHDLSHFPAKARRVIFLHMVGAPSQLDLFDYKPTLQKYNGKKLPNELWEGLQLAFYSQHLAVRLAGGAPGRL